MSQESPFYVGYLALPKAWRRFALGAGAFFLTLLILSAFALASTQKDPGDGSWDLNSPQTKRGYLTIDPYPVLHLLEPEADGLRVILPVEIAKFGAQKRLQAMGFKDGLVELSGFLIRRSHSDKRVAILELEEGNAGLTPLALDQQWQMDLSPKSLGIFTLFGEIVDPKCDLGVMKPGNGRVHKACAQLCISGGIPPMLVCKDQAGGEVRYLVCDSEGNPMPQAWLPLVAEPVQVSGEVFQTGGLLSIHITEISKLEE